MTTSFTRATDNTDAVVAIRDVDLQNRRCTGWNPQFLELSVSFSVMPGGVLVVPASGEQWLIRRTGRSAWVLVSRIPWQDARATLDVVEGMTVIGSSGPTVLTGERVELPSQVSFGPAQMRMVGVVLQTRATEAAAWGPVVAEHLYRVRLSAGQGTRALASNTLTALPFAAIALDDTGGAFELNRAGDPMGTVRCLRAGRYRVALRATTSAGANAIVNAYLAANGVRVAVGPTISLGTRASTTVTVETAETLDLAVDDTLVGQLYQNPGSGTPTETINDTAAVHNEMTLAYVA